MCLVLGRCGLDEWVGADPVFCLVEEVERVGMDVLLTPLVLDPTCQMRGPPVSLFFFFSSLPLLPSSSSPHGSSPGSSRRPLLSLRRGLPPQILPDAVPPPAPPDAGRCLPDSSPALPPRLLPGRSLPPGRLLAASAGRSLPPSVGRRSLPPRRTAPGRSSRAWTRACNGRTQRPSMQVDATSVEG